MSFYVSKVVPAIPSFLKNPLTLTQTLIKCPSVTPVEGGALTFLEEWLSQLGFTCYRLPFSTPGYDEVENLFALYKGKEGKPHFCFAGHTDVVPAGECKQWRYDPFQGCLEGALLHGRGAVDMKGAIGAFIAALARLLEQCPLEATISLLITGDEEGVAVNGTRKVLEWLAEKKIALDFCLVGEPTCQGALGDTIKIGRRGSLNTVLTVYGIQGHVAFPERSQNPVPYLIDILQELRQGPAEERSLYFDPSRLEITSVDVGNPVTNLISGKAQARFNIRFNDRHTGESLKTWITSVCKKYTSKFEVAFEVSGEAEFIEPNETVTSISNIIKEITDHTPVLTTAGATSDARFIRHYCPVIEFGLVGQTMHQVNECVSTEDLEKLTQIYLKIVTWFGTQ